MPLSPAVSPDGGYLDRRWVHASLKEQMGSYVRIRLRGRSVSPGSPPSPIVRVDRHGEGERFVSDAPPRTRRFEPVGRTEKILDWGFDTIPCSTMPSASCAMTAPAAFR